MTYRGNCLSAASHKEATQSAPSHTLTAHTNISLHHSDDHDMKNVGEV